MIRAPSEMRWRSMLKRVHCREHDCEHQRNANNYDGACAQPEADNTDHEDDGDQLPQRLHELVDGMVNCIGLVGDYDRLDTNRQVGLQLLHCVVNVFAEREHVAAIAHRNRQPQPGRAVDAEHRVRRIGIFPPHLGDVGQPHIAAADIEIHRENVFFRRHRAAHPQHYGLLVCGDHARRSNRVLRPQGSRKLRRLESIAGELRRRELDENAFCLLANEVHLIDIGHLQQPRSDILHVIAQLAMREPVGRKSIDDAVSVPEFVVRYRTDDALRQGQFDVFDLLADLIPGVRHCLRPGRSLEIDKDRRLTWLGVALDVVEIRRLLQLALDALRDLRAACPRVSRPATAPSPSWP